MQKPRGFQPISSGARLSGEALLRAVDTPMAGVPPAAVERPQPAVAPKTPQKAVPFMLRLAPTVFMALEQAAEQEGTTMTVMVARALRDAGYPVPEGDMKDRRRRRDYAAMAGEGG